jgi:hypothetical protein
VTGYLLIRELLMLAVVLAFGAGLMALVPAQERFTSRLALAPSAGVALASGILLTVNLVVPLRHAFWFVGLPAAIVSAVLVARSGIRRPPLREIIAVGMVLAVGLGAGSYALVERNSPGPVGYGIFDAPGYITYAQGYESYTSGSPLLDNMSTTDHKWRKPEEAGAKWGADWNISQTYGFGYRWQHTASNTINSVASGAAGWAPWTLATSLIIVLLAIGALGTYALAGYLGAGLIARTLAGFMYAGPLVYVAGMDGSEGLVAGLAAAPSVLVLTALFFERPTVRTAALFGAVIGGLQAVYPEMTPAVLGGLALAAIVRFGLPVARRRLPPSSLLPLAKFLPVAVGAGVLVGLRALPWTWQYLVAGGYNKVSGGLVPYNMAVQYLPGWIYQTREFYSFAFANPAGANQTLVGIILPLALMLISAAALILSSRARWLAGIFVAVVVQAWWASHSLDCAYCVQRSLLVLGPLLPALLLTGASLLMRRGGRTRDGVLVVGALAAVAIVSTTIHTQQRMREGLTVTPRALQAATEATGKIGRTTLLEGWGTIPFASWVYGPSSYAALSETTPRVSVVTPYIEYGGLAYIDTRPASDPAWTPYYDTVLTRLGGVTFPGRRTLAQYQPYTIQERARPFDVTIATGVASDMPEHEPLGAAYIHAPGHVLGFDQLPLKFWIAAETHGVAYISFRLQGVLPNINVTAPKGVTHVQSSRPGPDAIDICARVKSRAATREVGFTVTPQVGLEAPPLRLYEQAPQPNRDIRLMSVAASPKPCG